jgi:hypoxanthine-guanine phosphoribosyltransferase
MPAEVKVVTMLKRKNGTALSDFNGFEIEDEWVVGYGLDNNGLERNQNIIYSI